jgi:dihydroflavonol-4-reductase
MVFKTNTLGLRHVMDVCVEAGVKRLIHVSSVHAVEELPLSKPFDETRPYKTNTSSAYDYSKAMAEQYVLETAKKHAMDVVIVRPSSIVGPYDFKPSELGNALIRFYHNQIPILPPGGYDFVDVRDVAQTIIHAIERARANEIYILSGQYYSMKAFAQAVHEVSGKSVPNWVMPYWILKSVLPWVAGYAAITKSKPLFTKDSIDALKNGHPNMSSAKAIKELGHHARPLKESLHDFYHWQIIHQHI